MSLRNYFANNNLLLGERDAPPMTGQNVPMANPSHRYKNVSGPTDDLDLLWSKELEGVFSISVRGDSVYLGTNSLEIITLTIENGSTRWTVEVDPTMVGGPSPTVSDGGVYTCAADISEESGGVVYALDRGRGTIEWQSKVSGLVNSKPIVVDETVYVAGFNGRFYALDANSGVVEWEFDSRGDELRRFESGRVTPPSVVDGTAYVGTHDGLYALDTITGTTRWQYQIEDDVSSPTVVDGTVYVVSEDTLHAIEAVGGMSRWESELADYARTPAVVDSTVYVGSEMGVYAVDSATGAVEWHHETDSRMRTMPVVVDNTLYIGSGDGRIFGLNTTDGKMQWQYSLRQSSTAHTVVVNENLFVGTSNALYVFGNENGSETEVYESTPEHMGTNVHESGRGRTDTEVSEACSKCGTDLSPYDSPVFCPECGAKQ